MILDQFSAAQVLFLSLTILGVAYVAGASLLRIREYRAMYAGDR